LFFLPRLEVQTAKFVLPATPVAPLGRTREENFVLRQVSLAAGAAATVCVAINGAAGLTAAFGIGALYPTGFAWLIIAMSKAFSP
jgi:hypothetical protein